MAHVEMLMATLENNSLRAGFFHGYICICGSEWAREQWSKIP